MKTVFVYELLSGGGGAELEGDDSAMHELTLLGTDMRDALVVDLLALENVAVTCAVATPDPPPRIAEGLRLKACAPRARESAVEFVGRCARLHDHAWIVAPESAGTLARLCDAVAPSRWLGCARPAIVLTGSKQATARQLAQHGIAATQPWEPQAKVDPRSDTWVVKPDDGAGATETRVHRSFAAAAADYSARLARKQLAVLEPWVEGEALSVSVLCSGDSGELLSINRQTIDVDRGGALTYRGVLVNAIECRGWQGQELRQLAQRVIGAVPGLQGFVGIDVVWHPYLGPVVIEINPRVTCAYVGLSAALRRNLARDVLQIFDRTGAGRFAGATMGMAH